MGRARLAACVGIAAAMAATFACRQLVGIGDDPPQGQVSPSTDSGAEGGFTYGQGDCATCVTTSCGPQATACAGTPSCAALEACMSGCGTDATCRAQCGVDHGLGNDVATPAFEACLASSCETQCGLTCGGLAAVFPPATATGCEACILKQECQSTSACAADPGCQTSIRCQFSSSTPDVVQACPPLQPDAGPVSIVNERSAPIASSCSTACSWGADWSCVGKVNWPAARLGALEVTASVKDGLTNTPVADASVKFCTTLDPTCVLPIQAGTTDGAGNVTLVLPPVMGPTFYYGDVSSPAIAPLLVFGGSPFSEPRFAWPFITATPAELALGSQGLGVTGDPKLGAVFVGAVDCRLASAPGVTFAIDPPGTSAGPFYYASAVPSMTATETDSEGLAVFINVPVIPTTLVVTATPKALGRPSSHVPLFARADGTALVYVLPTP
jgi:hypothetical protein